MLSLLLVLICFLDAYQKFEDAYWAAEKVFKKDIQKLTSALNTLSEIEIYVFSKIRVWS